MSVLGSTPLAIKDLGPCQVEWGGVRLGKSHGNVIFRYSEQEKDVFEDGQGDAPVDSILMGATCEVEVPLTRLTLAQLAKVIGDGTVLSTNLTMVNPVGVSQYDKAEELILKPIVDSTPSVTESQYLSVFKASPRVDAEITYGRDGQRVFKVIFKAYPNQTTGSVGDLWEIG